MKDRLNSVSSFSDYTLLFLVKGSGTLELDFRNYQLSAGKALFLTPGQYMRKLSGDLEMIQYTFEGDPLEQVRNSRFLFRHLVSIGYVHVSKPKRFHLPELRLLQINDDAQGLLELAVSDWLQLNPFKATRNEIDLLFDLKDFIDQHYREQPALDTVAKGLMQQGHYLNRLTKSRLSITVNRLLHEKLMREAKQKLAFTDYTTKELAYDLGFQYPTYFNRFFKNHSSKSPGEFRETFGADLSGVFREEFSQLLNTHFTEHRFMPFYAEKLHLSVKSLSSRLRSSFGTGFQELMNQKLLTQGKALIGGGENITETAYQLGFREPNHFSAFFKKHTGISPSQFRVN